ncbi:MAG: S9 family peptidase [Actinomycetota bacterium]
MTHDRGRGIQSFHWAPDGRHVIYGQDRGGDENWRLYITEVDTQKTRELTPFDGVQALVLRLSKRHPGSMLVGLNRDDPSRHDAFRLELSTGSLEKVAENPGFARWIVDRDLRVRGGVRATADGGCEVLMSDDGGRQWRPIFTAGLDEGLELLFGWPMELSADDRSLIMVCAKDSNTSRLVRMDLGTGSIETIAGDPEYDVRAVMFQPDSGRPQVAYVEKDRLVPLILDPSIEEDFAELSRVHHGDFVVAGRDDADRSWVVEFHADDTPSAYYLYRRDLKQAQLLFEDRPELRRYRLAAMQPFQFPARDGLTIHGYLTFPPGSETRRLPTVVKVHGGPQARDSWRFDPWAQLFASRGYLCVHVNYRGSMGYGKQFLFAGDKQWGRAMHHDVLDAIGWLVDHGHSDPARIAMWGTSYGGYETLVTVTSDPDLLACAVAGMAPVNLVSFMESLPAYWSAQRALLTRQCGDPEAEGDLLWERSPLRLVDRIRTPLLMFYGDGDPRVTVGEAEQLAKALESHGIPHELHVLSGEGHSLDEMSPEYLRLVVERTEAFLEHHLRPDKP